MLDILPSAQNSTYRPIVNIQRVEFAGVLHKVLLVAGPIISRLISVDFPEALHSCALCAEVLCLVAADGRAHSAPCTEHPESTHPTWRCYVQLKRRKTCLIGVTSKKVTYGSRILIDQGLFLL